MMLSIARVRTGQAGYYVQLAADDYYVRGPSEAEGKWWGESARRLGLHGTVKPTELRNLLCGFSPDGAVALVQNAGHQDKHAGLDCCFQAPKSVSILAELAPTEMRHAIIRAHDAAVVKGGLSYLQDEAAKCRRGKGGTEFESVGVVASVHLHNTSRTYNDPHIHSHALIMDVAVRDDWTTGSLHTLEFFKAKMTAGALYRLELSRQLERLGLTCERQGSWFEVVGVPPALKDEFSKRRRDIEAKLDAQGLAGPVAAAKAALDTRKPKGQLPPKSELREKWLAIAEEHGFGTEQAKSLLYLHEPRYDLAARVNSAIAQASERLASQQNHFSERELLRFAAEAGQGQGISADVLRYQVHQTLQRSEQIVRLGSFQHTPQYTTREILKLEKELLEAVETLASEKSHSIAKSTVSRVINERPTLRNEQEVALRHILGPERAAVVIGVAGTGKTFLLDAARTAWHLEGRVVLGACLSGKAAAGLEEAAHFPCSTIHKLLYDLRAGRVRLSQNHVVVVDEAGMAPTALTNQLVQHIANSGAKLVTVGDPRQLQPVEGASPLRALGHKLGKAELNQILRQRDAWARTAIWDVIRGRSRKALAAFAEHGQLFVSDDGRSAIHSLLTTWAQGGLERPQEHQIFCATRAEAAALNRRAQSLRLESGHVKAESVRVGNEKLHEGDRILCTRNSTPYQVQNGSLGTIEKISPRTRVCAIRLDNGRRIALSCDDYPHLTLGYAMTTHKGQGVTVNHAYVLSTENGLQDRELSYVQFSRARLTTSIFTDRESAGPELHKLSRQVERTRQKRLAHELLPVPHTGEML